MNPPLKVRRPGALACALLVSLCCGCESGPRGPLAYVTNERAGTITVVDTATDEVVDTIEVGGRPRG